MRAVVVMGPPGAGKSTIGRALSERFPDSLFVSTGQYMREEMGLIPPFIGLDHSEVIRRIFNGVAPNSLSTIVIDCNPFPVTMHDSLVAHLNLNCTDISWLEIRSPKDVLLSRMSSRGRVDSMNFSYEERLNYYYDNVQPVIDSMSDVISYDNTQQIEFVVEEIVKGLHYD